MNEIKKHFDVDSSLTIPLGKIMDLYPKVKDRIIPLSVTGVPARTFFHWKNNGIIDYPIASGDERIRVKLNLFEFVWIRACVFLRDFGFPLSALRDVKEQLFQDMGEIMIRENESILKNIDSNPLMDAETKKFLNAFLPKLKQHYSEFAEEHRIYTSVIGSLIATILLYNQEAAVFIIKKLEGTEFKTFSWGTLAEYEQHSESFIGFPHIMIPFRPIIADFLKNSDNEKYLDKFDFLHPKEKKILEYLKKKDFSELQIKNIEGVIKVVKNEDIDIMGDKVSEIRRILGLNEYSSVTLSLRNGKHIFCKQKTNIK